MPLPILRSQNNPSDAQLIGLFDRTEEAWVGALAEPEPLEVGTAHADAALPDVWWANQVRDVALPPGATSDRAWAEVSAHFAARCSRCALWVMNPHAAPERVGPMVAFLLAQGAVREPIQIMYLRHRPPGLPRELTGVQVIPARASFRHAEKLARAAAEERWPGAAEQLVQARMRRLDDPRWDYQLALSDGRAVAGAGVLTVGELGRIEQVYVAPDWRRRGLARALMGRVLETCARGMLRHVFLTVDRDNEPARALYRGLGFVTVGEMACYRIAPG